MNVLQEEYNNNKIIIENYLKRQEELKIIIDREKKINLMTDDKFDILQDSLNKMLELQKQYNIIVSDRKSSITKKYLPLPYDVNEIIRKKIITDSKLKIEQEYISLLGKKYKYKILDDVLNNLCRNIRKYSSGNSFDSEEEFKNILEEYFNVIKHRLDFTECEEYTIFECGYNNRELLNKEEHRKQIEDIYDDMFISIIHPLCDVIRLLVDDIELLNPSHINYDKIKSFSGFSILKKNGHYVLKLLKFLSHIVIY